MELLRPCETVVVMSRDKCDLPPLVSQHESFSTALECAQRNLLEIAAAHKAGTLDDMTELRFSINRK